MKEVKEMAAQGDVLFKRVDGGKVPDGFNKTKNKVVAHSETGHHHTVAGKVTVYESPTNPMLCYLQMGAESCEVVHQRPWDTHETLRLLGNPGSVWEIRRQREWAPEGWRRVED